jgi:hypothetical protein
MHQKRKLTGQSPYQLPLPATLNFRSTPLFKLGLGRFSSRLLPPDAFRLPIIAGKADMNFEKAV